MNDVIASFPDRYSAFFLAVGEDFRDHGGLLVLIRFILPRFLVSANLELNHVKVAKALGIGRLKYATAHYHALGLKAPKIETSCTREKGGCTVAHSALLNQSEEKENPPLSASEERVGSLLRELDENAMPYDGVLCYGSSGIRVGEYEGF